MRPARTGSAALALALVFILSACGPAGADSGSGSGAGADWAGLDYDHSLALEYARQFSVDYYAGGYARIEIGDGSQYLLVPEGEAVPDGLDSTVTVLSQPLNNIYLAATSAMDLICALDCLDRVRLSAADVSGWYLDEAVSAMEEGRLLYAGKYNAPDYELLFAQGCGLAIESTMIYHAPEVKAQLETLGIPVLVERSSYESHPLGRMEWIKLYGVLFGQEEAAQDCFQAQLDALAPVMDQAPTGKTVAFFYLTPNGSVNVRKSGDYISKMIQMAGGRYIFEDLTGEDNALSTVNMDMESFYTGAKNADILIYNSTIYGELTTLEELLSQSALLADFKAVREGKVWCTEKNLFQSTMGLGDMILDLHTILTEEDPPDSRLTYLHRLT